MEIYTSSPFQLLVVVYLVLQILVLMFIVGTLVYLLSTVRHLKQEITGLPVKAARMVLDVALSVVKVMKN